jgi:hypothetical protein
MERYILWWTIGAVAFGIVGAVILAARLMT